jgi:hypothetical protein
MIRQISVLAAVAALSLLAAPASADTILYTVTVDTSSVSGSSGYLEFQLNTGSLVAGAVTASVMDFMGATVNMNDPNDFSSIGSFPLPGTLTLTSSSSTDYFEAATFGSSITFQAELSGPGVDLSGNAGSSSDTEFSFDFTDTSFNYLLTNDPNGVVGLIDVAAVGTVNTQANPDAAGGPSVATFSLGTAAPEPSSMALMGLALAVGWAAARRARRY